MSLKTAGSSENRTTLESGGSANAPYEKEKINLHDQRSFILYTNSFLVGDQLLGEAEVALSRVRTQDEYRQVLESSLEEYGKLSRMVDSLLIFGACREHRIRD